MSRREVIEIYEKITWDWRWMTFDRIRWWIKRSYIYDIDSWIITHSNGRSTEWEFTYWDLNKIYLWWAAINTSSDVEKTINEIYFWQFIDEL